MSWRDFLPLNLRKGYKPGAPPTGSFAAVDARAGKAWEDLGHFVAKSGETDATRMVREVLSKGSAQVARAQTVGVPDIGFKGIRQQLFQRFNLVDLYAISHNNSTLKTAMLNLKQEVFRRGMEWEPAFAYRCEMCGTDYSKQEADTNSDHCPECNKATDEEGQERVDDLTGLPLRARMRKPDQTQRIRFEQVMQRANNYGQSLLRILQMCEDDLNIADDAFVYMASEYRLMWGDDGKERITREVKQLFRLDPIFVEFDVDEENRPGFKHHICLAHRDNLLDIPPDDDWEHDWQGRCPIDGHSTFPVIWRYTPYRGTFGAYRGGEGPERQALYLVKGEVLHSSKFSPGELYGYSAVLSIYEKALSLIGMDRYLYDYFFERQIPQGVITTVTDNTEDLETRKEQMLSDVLNNPHHIPWMAVSSKTGQGKTEFVRFAYSLDELQFLPVQESIERSVAGLYGVPGLFMGREESTGGLNNESQQLVRMSRGAVLSQDIYNTEILPGLLRAFGITDWVLKLRSSEERSEQLEWEIKQRKSQWANTHVQMGFGIKYLQDTDDYEITGEVKPKSEQEQGFGGYGSGGDFGGGGFGADDDLGGFEPPGPELGSTEPQELGIKEPSDPSGGV